MIIQNPADSICAYIKAKDGNRPHLLNSAFADDAELRMILKTDAIAFPATCVGRIAIADTLVSRFNQSYENIYTFCIGAAPEPNSVAFSCDWLVAMSEKQGGSVRVGCGRYDWSFTASAHRVSALVITLETMVNLPADTLNPVMQWVSDLSYPFCTRAEVTRNAPDRPALLPVFQYLRQP